MLMKVMYIAIPQLKNIQEGALKDFQKSKQYAKTKQLYIENGLSEKEAELAIRESYVGPLNMYEGQNRGY